MHCSQLRPTVLCWQSSHTPPLVFPVAMYTAMSKWHCAEWPLQLHSVTKMNIESSLRGDESTEEHAELYTPSQIPQVAHTTMHNATSEQHQALHLHLTQTHFCMRYYCGLRQVAKVSHGRNPNTAHNSSPWYYACTCSARGPVIKIKTYIYIYI